MEFMVLDNGNVLPQQPLNANKVAGFRIVAERVRHAFSPRTRRASNAVHVDLRFVGQIEIEHVRDVVNVDATAGDVGGDEHVHTPLLEILQRLGARRLRLVAVDGFSVDVLLSELSGKPVGAVLGSGEDDGTADALLVDELDEQSALVRLLHEEHVLLDAVGGDLLGTDVHRHRVVQHLGHNVVHRSRHGRAEQQILPLVRHHSNHALDVVNEAHVEHAVGLVKHEVFHVPEIDVTLLFQVEQSTWCGHEDVDAASKGIDLRTLSNTAEDDLVTQTERSAVHFDAVADLSGQFARWREDEGANGAPSLDAFRREVMEDGQGERRGFPRSRLRNAEHVTAVQRRWNRLRLNRRWLRVAFVLDGVEQFVTQAEVLEGRHGLTTCGRNLRGDPSARPTIAMRGSPRMKQGGSSRSERRACSPRHDDRNRTLGSLCHSMSKVEAAREGRTKSAHLDEALDQFSRLVDDQFL